MLSGREQGVSSNCTELASDYPCTGSWGAPSWSLAQPPSRSLAQGHLKQQLRHIAYKAAFVPIAVQTGPDLARDSCAAETLE